MHQANRQQSGPSAILFSYCAGMKIISEAKLPIYQKILNGLQGNEASKTAVSVEMHNGLEAPPTAILRIIPT